MEPESDYQHEKAEKWIALAKKADAEGDKETLENVRRELNLLNRIFGRVGQTTNIWEWCLLNLNEPFREWRKEGIDYYAKRYRETADPTERARYAYVLWVFKKEFKFAEVCIANFAAAGESYFSNGWYNKDSYYISMAFSFEFAAKLSTKLGAKPPNDLLTIVGKIVTINLIIVI